MITNQSHPYFPHPHPGMHPGPRMLWSALDIILHSHQQGIQGNHAMELHVTLHHLTNHAMEHTLPSTTHCTHHYHQHHDDHHRCLTPTPTSTTSSPYNTHPLHTTHPAPSHSPPHIKTLLPNHHHFSHHRFPGLRPLWTDIYYTTLTPAGNSRQSGYIGI